KCCQLSASVAQTITRNLYIKDNDGQRADYIFIDPPYDSIEANLRRIFARVEQLSTPDASVILELPGELEPKVDGWRLIRRLGKSKRGSPSVAIFKR
ncbi:MAG: RsmD family RNA methyltransferase, partial [Verrucomicrobiota bacterium]|nr:RsmD family RNA methyltransferase [Verrucomicrobiota bacterium]